MSAARISREFCSAARRDATAPTPMSFPDAISIALFAVSSDSTILIHGQLCSKN